MEKGSGQPEDKKACFICRLSDILLLYSRKRKESRNWT
jgi:hypothetical protein